MVNILNYLIGDNLGVLFCFITGSSRNLFADEILKNLSDLWLTSPVFLHFSYIKSADNPADETENEIYTRG